VPAIRYLGKTISPHSLAHYFCPLVGHIENPLVTNVLDDAAIAEIW